MQLVEGEVRHLLDLRDAKAPQGDAVRTPSALEKRRVDGRVGESAVAEARLERGFGPRGCCLRFRGPRLGGARVWAG